MSVVRSARGAVAAAAASALGKHPEAQEGHTAVVVVWTMDTLETLGKYILK